MDDDLWRRRINECLATVREWEKRTSDEDGTPQQGSRLAVEDRRNPSLTFSTVAWSSIGIAVDHLGMADDALSRDGGGRLRPFGFYTTTRGALVAAAQAIWVMTGSRETRLRRLRLVELAETDGMLSFVQDYTRDETLADEISPEMAESLRNRADRLNAKKRDLKRTLAPRRGEGSVTNMLRDAAEQITAQSDPNDAWLRRSYMTEWRLASGGAHARIWPGDIRPNETVPLIGTKTKLRTSSASAESYGMSLGVATMAVSEAFRLWDEAAAASD